MQRSIVRITTAALAVLALAAPASAQEPADSARRFTVHLLPSTTRVSSQWLGFGRPPAGTEGAWRLEGARAFGLAAEVRTPLRFLDLRAGIEHAQPRLSGVSLAPRAGDYPNQAGITTLTLDAVVRGPRVLDATPYLLVGGGIERYGFNPTGVEIEDGEFPEDQTIGIFQVGAGLSWKVGRYDLYLEAREQYGAPDPVPGFDRGQGWQYNTTIGLRIPIR